MTGKYRIDIPTVITMISCPYVKIQDLGVKILAIMSDLSNVEFQNYDLQFENHIKFLIERTLDMKKSYEFKNYIIQSLANLSLKDSMRALIVYNQGVEAMLYHIRNENNVEGQRLAAKSLLNLSINSSRRRHQWQSICHIMPSYTNRFF